MLAKIFPAFKNRDFRIFWLSDFIARVGTQLLTVTISWQLYLLTHSAFALGLIGVFQIIPLLLLNFLGGVTADVYNRKKILYITGFLLVCTSSLLGITTVFHIISPIIVYFLITIVAAINAFNYPAYGSILPAIVNKEGQSIAASTFGLQEDMSEMLGPTLAGFLIASIGIGNIYFLDALSTVISLIALFMMSYTGKPSSEKSSISLVAVKEGYNFLVSKKVLWSSMMLDTFSVLFASAIVLMPIFANDVLHIGPRGLGFLYAAPSVGAVIVGFFLARGITIYRQGKILFASVAVYAIATILFGASKSFLLSLFALAVIGGANLVSVTIRSVIRQTLIPPHMFGRLYSFYSFFWIIGDKIGDIEGGFVAQLFGAPLATVIGGVGALIVVSSMAIFNLELRNHRLAGK
jgi:MFS family permease